ncbi:MAG TPA: nucleotide exchange factor GrpE [Anaerolineae bacterium]|nr:nucleotide exchange factor GrpE [Anaerolineae bacterium]
MAIDNDLNGRIDEKDESAVVDTGQAHEVSEPDASTGVQQEDYDILKERLSQKEAEAAEYLDKLKRVQAEMENFRKRMLKEQEQIIQHAAQTVIRELLPVIDNLERALDAANAESDAAKLREGIELIYSQIQELLTREYVEVIDPLGRAFDPQKHEAVMQVASDEYEENAVTEVLQKGYELKGRLLRPAMVKVAR